MLYLILQFLVLLLAAFVLGVGIGWLLWGRMMEYLRHTSDVESTKFQTRAADLSNELKYKAAEVARLQADLARALADDAALRAELEDARQDQLEVLAQLGARERELAELRENDLTRGGATEQLERALAECRAARRAAEGEITRLRASVLAGEVALGGGGS